MKLRITSNGNFPDTRIENAETGELLEGVSSFVIHGSAEGYWNSATITIHDVALGILVETGLAGVGKTGPQLTRPEVPTRLHQKTESADNDDNVDWPEQ